MRTGSYCESVCVWVCVCLNHRKQTASSTNVNTYRDGRLIYIYTDWLTALCFPCVPRHLHGRILSAESNFQETHQFRLGIECPSFPFLSSFCDAKKRSILARNASGVCCVPHESLNFLLRFSDRRRKRKAWSKIPIFLCMAFLLVTMQWSASFFLQSLLYIGWISSKCRRNYEERRLMESNKSDDTCRG